VWARRAPLLATAGLAFAAGIAVGASNEDPRRTVAQNFVDAWSRGDYAAMRGMLTPEDREAVSAKRFSNAYRQAARQSTLSAVTAGEAAEPENGAVRVPVALRTRLFGTIRGELVLPVIEEQDGAAIDWARHLVHPGLRPGEQLSRSTTMPPRATIQARDGTPLAEGEARFSELGALASEIAGRLGPAPPERAAELARRGVPPGAPVG
jgi:hypothetical protein